MSVDDQKDDDEKEETFFQYCMRLSREARLRKEAIEREASDRKRKRKEQSKEERRRERENRRQLSPHLMAIAKEVAKEKAAKSVVIKHRKELRFCICCGDDRDIKGNGYCEECWIELEFGVIEPPVVSERQLNASRCRVVRKGTEMS